MKSLGDSWYNGQRKDVKYLYWDIKGTSSEDMKLQRIWKVAKMN